MRVVIFEANQGGHRLHYVRTVAQAFGQIAPDVTVAVARDALDSTEFKTHLADLADRITIDAGFTGPQGSVTQIAAGKMRAVRDVVRRLKPDLLCLPTADGLTQMLGVAHMMGLRPLGRQVQVDALLLRGRFAYPRERWRDALIAPAWLAATAGAPFRTLHVLDPMAFEALLSRGEALARRCRLIPEPVEPAPVIDPRAARRALGLPEAGRYVGCAGGLNSRKGIDRLIRAFAAAARRPDDRLLLMGRAQPDILALVRGPFASLVADGSIRLVDRYVDPAELARCLGALDVVCTPYPRHIGSSSILIRAAAAQRMLLGSDFGWVHMAITRFGLGDTCNVGNLPAFAQAISRALNRSGDFHLEEKGRRFVQYHTIENFQAHWTAEPRRQLGLPPAPGMRSWPWVLEAVDAASPAAAGIGR